MRLSLNKHGSPSGDFAEDSFRVSGNSKESFATEPPNKTAARATPKGTVGPGESPFLRFPRVLFGTFSRERKYQANTEDEEQKKKLPQSANADSSLEEGAF